MGYMSENDRLLAREHCKWDEGFSFVAGIDEAGRGCIAGPVVAAAVVFTDRTRIPEGLDDSKKLTPKRRMELRELILAEPSILTSVAEFSSEEIDRSDILRCTWKAMAIALSGIKQAQFALVDGNPVPNLPTPSQSIIKGDSLSASIAAASILAKTHRDMVMDSFAAVYPEYHFEIHKGYCTAEHVGLVKKLGPCPIHRKTFEPVKSILNPPEFTQGEFSF